MTQPFRAHALRLLREIQRHTKRDIITATPFMGDEELLSHILQCAFALEEDAKFQLLAKARAELIFATEARVKERS